MSEMVLKSKNTGFEVLKLRDAGDDDDDATAAERQALRRDAEVIAVYVQELADTLYFLLPSRATLRITVIKLCICNGCMGMSSVRRGDFRPILCVVRGSTLYGSIVVGIYNRTQQPQTTVYGWSPRPVLRGG